MRMEIKRYVFAVAMMVASAPAWAGSASAHLEVSVQVVPNCQISITNLAFGIYDPLVANSAHPLDATADLRMLCTRNAQASVKLDYGRNAVAENRTLAAADERVSYDLYLDSARTQRWAMGDNAYHVTGGGARDPQLIRVYGRIPAGQDVPPGTYGDTVTAAVDF